MRTIVLVPAFAIISLLVLGLPTTASALLQVDIDPSSHNFGEVALGGSSAVSISITNPITSTGPSLPGLNLATGGMVTIDDIKLQGINGPDFSITSAPTLPIVLLIGQSVNIEITYTPLSEGSSFDLLMVYLLGGLPAAAFLSGVGVTAPEPEPTPAELIAEILVFFDESVANGDLAGKGPGNSADKRLNAFGNMLKAASDLIEAEESEEACQQLLDAYRRIDGESNPPDFVGGTAAADLASKIDNLRAVLGCE